MPEVVESPDILHYAFRSLSRFLKAEAGSPIIHPFGDLTLSSTTEADISIDSVVKPLAQSRTLKRVAVYALMTGLYAAIPAAKEYSSYASFGDQPADIHAALTFVLGMLLVFRTNAAYARWWEARTLWGGLVNATRNLAIKLNALARIDEADFQKAQQLIGRFAPLLRDHLRRPPGKNDTESLDPDTASIAHLPSDVVERLYVLLAKWKSVGQIDGDELRIIDNAALRLLDICGGCERIRNTRIVRSYRVFARQCVVLSLLTFPWGIANEFRWWTVPVTTILAYFMLGLETVAEHVEEPFGYDEDDLDLDGLCDTITKSVNQIFARRVRIQQEMGVLRPSPAVLDSAGG